MQLNPCGCLWDWEGDALNIVPCENDRDEVERVNRIAWKLVARRKMSFREAYEYLAMKFVYRLLSDTKKSIP